MREKKNIVLTGMPGSGKSAVGKALSKLTDRHLYDVDTMIEQRYAHPGEIIRTQGEGAFRDIESEVVREISLHKGCVISTGGGTILRKENIENLKKNGVIFFLDRDLNDLVPTDDRPLSSTREKLEAVYYSRIDIYNSTCDFAIKGGFGAEKEAEMILEKMAEEDI